MSRLVALVLVSAGLVSAAHAVSTTAGACKRDVGRIATRCLDDYVDAIDHCRTAPDSACEALLRSDPGPLVNRVGDADRDAARACTDGALEPLGFLDRPDASLRASDACRDFAEDALATTWSPHLAGLTPPERRCQRVVARAFDALRAAVIAAHGPGCYVPEGRGSSCNRRRRDAAVARAAALARKRIVRACPDDVLADLDLPSDSPAGALVDEIVDRAAKRARHMAQLVYPPRDLGPSSLPGPYPIGVRTITFVDDTRLAVGGTGGRPVKVEVYYPSTAAAIAGKPRDVVSLFNIPLATTTAYRDVDRAAGAFPLVLFSHGNLGIRFQSFFFAAHLASHGYVVVSPDHHGNTFVDQLAGIVDPDSAVNRPLDLRFLLDTLLGLNATAGNFFTGALDPAKIGVSGHSFGGYTTLAIAGGAGPAGTFTDTRVKAIFPQAPFSPFSAAFYATIHVPTLIVGGSLDTTTPFAVEQEPVFAGLPSGASVVGLAELDSAGHFTFSDFCEVDRTLLAFLGGFDEACQPRHLPWRYAHDVVNLLSLDFFDATLRGDAAARARLAALVSQPVDDLTYREK